MLPYFSLTFWNQSHIIQHRGICKNKNKNECVIHVHSNVPAGGQTKYMLCMSESPHADRFKLQDAFFS